MSADREQEVEILTREAGRKLAEACRSRPPPASVMDIPPSLLSAEDIRAVVMATGLISPFYMHGRKPRLKKASYEGRIGDKAYLFENGRIVPATFNDDKLYIPENSIVFVESDLDFRLPEYIALRFNLHIEHVHRGLLLGTGPLVDPGFWGKLCIPLHNLTSEPYEIPRGEGLIWLEFTRTTSRISTPEEALGVAPSTSGYWDILDFIKKAAKGVGGASNVSIQSSIGGALLSAHDAAKNAERYTLWLSGLGIVSIIALIVAIIALGLNTISTINGQVSLSRQLLDEARKDFRILTERVDVQANDVNRQGVKLESFAPQLGALNSVQERLDKLEEAIKALSAIPPRATAPSSDQAPLTMPPKR
jgi:deoxycytidine triphosphate deaminase